MDRHFTVYFDTNFYIWLGSAEDEDADRVLRVFNERKIRYVHSSYVVLELLSGRERRTQDKNLVERLKRWNTEPYPVHLGYSNDGDLVPWDLLLLAGNARKEHSEELKKIFDLETIARSFSHIADKPLSNDQKSHLEQALKPFLEDIGIKDDSSDAEKAAAYLKSSADQLSRLRHFLPPESAKKFDEIDLTKPSTVENLTELAEKMRTILTNPVVSRLEQEVLLMNSVLALDDRPISAAIGHGSRSEIKKLGNSMRDAVHMSSLLSHSEHIDLLQVDSRQLSLILRNKPEHLISKHGLSDRCFSTPDLESTVLFVINYDGGGE